MNEPRRLTVSDIRKVHAYLKANAVPVSEWIGLIPVKLYDKFMAQNPAWPHTVLSRDESVVTVSYTSPP
jgi:hypothetical protein